jgi:hypothetical protein
MHLLCRLFIQDSWFMVCSLHAPSNIPVNVSSSQDIVKMLIQAGADVFAEDAFGLTPIYGAVKNGFDEVIDILRTYGARSEKMLRPLMQSSCVY